MKYWQFKICCVFVSFEFNLLQLHNGEELCLRLDHLNMFRWTTPPTIFQPVGTILFIYSIFFLGEKDQLFQCLTWTVQSTERGTRKKLGKSQKVCQTNVHIYEWFSKSFPSFPLDHFEDFNLKSTIQPWQKNYRLYLLPFIANF